MDRARGMRTFAPEEAIPKETKDSWSLIGSEGKVNRNRNGGIIKSVDGLASSCQWIEGCTRRSFAYDFCMIFEERF